MPVSSPLLSSKKEIINLYLKQQKNCPEIAKIFKVDKSCIVRNLKKWNVKIRPRKIFSEKNHKKIINLYNRYKSALKVSEKLGVSEPTILEIIKKYNIPVYGNFKRNHLIENAIEYYKQTKSLSKVNKKFGFDIRYFKKILQKNNIPLFYEDKLIRYNYETKTLELMENFEEVKRVFEKTKNVCEVLKIFNCKRSNFNTACKHHNYNIKLIIGRKNNFQLFNKHKNEIIKEYRNNVSVLKLSNKYKIWSNTLSKFLLKEIPDEYRFKKEANTLKNQNEEFQRYCIKQSYRSKNYTLPSGRIIKVQGYENQFLDHVFQNNLLVETEIEYDPPRFQYSKRRHYYPDFHIPKINTVIEIKSSYTYKIRDVRKEKAVKKAGYNILFIIDNNFEKLGELLNDTSAKK